MTFPGDPELGDLLAPALQERPLHAPASLPFVGIGGAPDDWIVEMVRQGDPRAFEQIVERYRDPLYRYCQGITGHAQDAEEALQTTMLRAFQALGGMDRRVVLRPWLFRIARNVCIDLIRGRHPWTELTPASEPATADVQEQHEVRERLAGLARDLAGLDEVHRSALLLRELSGLSHREIGDTLGTSPESAKRLIFEARESLLEREAGRDLACGDVRARIGEHDGRMLRSRRMRAHLDECEACAAFRDGLRSRPRQLAALFPALPAAAVARLLDVLVGAGVVAGGGGGMLTLLTGAGGVATFTGFAGQTAALLSVAVIGGSVLVPGMVATGTTRDRGTAVSGRTLDAVADILTADATPAITGPRRSPRASTTPSRLATGRTAARFTTRTAAPPSQPAPTAEAAPAPHHSSGPAGTAAVPESSPAPAPTDLTPPPMPTPVAVANAAPVAPPSPTPAPAAAQVTPPAPAPVVAPDSTPPVPQPPSTVPEPIPVTPTGGTVTPPPPPVPTPPSGKPDPGAGSPNGGSTGGKPDPVAGSPDGGSTGVTPGRVPHGDDDDGDDDGPAAHPPPTRPDRSGHDRCGGHRRGD